MSKFEDDGPTLSDDQPDYEDKFHAQLQQFVIIPFAERLQPFLSEIFIQLNFDDSLHKSMKEAKRNKR